jgi:hypothetical protein
MTKHTGQWKEGQSGNPKGRPRGSGVIAELRRSIAEHVPGIIAKQVELAQAGDTTAARLLLERVLPPVKAMEPASAFDLPDGGLSEQGRHILGLVAGGELAPGQGAQLLTAIGTLAKVIEMDEFERRLKALEAKHGS